MEKMTVYISGPITGKLDGNRAVFEKAAFKLKALGYKAINPTDSFGGRLDLPWEVYLEHDKLLLSLSDAVALLPGWENSKGVLVEIEEANRLGIPQYPFVDFLDDKVKPKNILEEALGLCDGDRQKAYGHPYDDYKATAAMFNAWMYKKREGRWEDLKASDITMLMVFVKLSREANLEKRDNLVDGAGYLYCRDKVIEKEREERNTSIEDISNGYY